MSPVARARTVTLLAALLGLIPALALGQPHMGRESTEGVDAICAIDPDTCPVEWCFRTTPGFVHPRRGELRSGREAPRLVLLLGPRSGLLPGRDATRHVGSRLCSVPEARCATIVAQRGTEWWESAEPATLLFTDEPAATVAEFPERPPAWRLEIASLFRDARLCPLAARLEPERRAPPPSFIHREHHRTLYLRYWGFEWTAEVQVGLMPRSSRALAGGGLRLGLWDARQRRPFPAVLGNWWGVDVRGRGLTPFGAADGRLLLIGVQPRLSFIPALAEVESLATMPDTFVPPEPTSSPAYNGFPRTSAKYRLPSLLGIALPEVGYVLSDAIDAPYLSWGVPLAWMLTHSLALEARPELALLLDGEVREPLLPAIALALSFVN